MGAGARAVLKAWFGGCWLEDRAASLKEPGCLAVCLLVCSWPKGGKGVGLSPLRLSHSVTCGWDRTWTWLFLDCGGPRPRVTYQKVIIPVACHGGGR